MQKKYINICLLISIIFLFINKYIAIIPIIISFYLINKKEKIKSNNISELLQNENLELNNQLNNYETKIKLIKEILTNYFNENSLTYIKYISIINNLTNVFYLNVETINKYFNLVNEDFILKHKTIDKPLKEIHKLLNNNNFIIEKINNLLIELKKIDITNQSHINFLIDELENVTKNTKKYMEV